MGDFMDGILLVNKEEGFTSRDMVNKVGNILGTKKIGHTGTLDPMATGVLVMCVGKCTKLVDIITSDYKEYVAGVRIGLLTDTLDITGNVIKTGKFDFSRDEIVDVINSMIGYYDQEVPIYSAVKINGRKLYEYARNNIEVILPKRRVHVKDISLVSDISYNSNYIEFSIRCVVSKGTYIRSLIRDISFKLGSVGIMSSLIRTKQGEFNITDCYSLKDIESGNYKFYPLIDYFSDIRKEMVSEELKKDILNGKIIDNIYNCDKILFVDSLGGILAIYSLYDKDSSKLKPYKMFGGIK